MQRRRHPEQELQKAVAAFLDVALPRDAFWFHCPNGGKRSPVEAAILKSMGVKAGVPDICIAYRASLWCIEIKSDDNDVTVPQAVVHKHLALAGAPTAICRSLREVEQTLRDWSFPLTARAA